MPPPALAHLGLYHDRHAVPKIRAHFDASRDRWEQHSQLRHSYSVYGFCPPLPSVACMETRRMAKTE